MSGPQDMEDGIGPEHADDIAAAEYVLGVTGLEARRAAEARIADDPAFAAAVLAWQARLSTLDARFEDVAPPSSLKRGLDVRLFGAEARPARPGMFGSLAFWRMTTAAAAFAALVLAAGPILNPPLPPVAEAPRVATIVSEDGAAIVVVADSTARTLRVTASVPAPEGRDHELWLIAGEQAPVSVGLLSREGVTSLAFPADQDAMAALTFAVSIEPVGGSTTGAPTGPVIGAGALTKI